MKYADEKYNLKVSDRLGEIKSGCLIFVYDAGTKTLSTIYSDGARKAKTNPISRAQHAIDAGLLFYSASASHDITVCHSDGSIGHYAGITPNDHVLTLDRDGHEKVIVVPFGSDTDETDTGVDIPVNSLIKDVVVEVVAGHSGKTIDVGLLSSESSGDADGLVAALSIASTGFIRPFSNTAGGNETYVSTAKYGVLMGPSVVGTDVDKDNGVGMGMGHIVSGSNAKSLCYTCSSTTTTANGYIYVSFKKLR